MSPPGSRGVPEKPSNFKAAWSRLFAYMESYKYAAILAIVLMVAATIMMLIGPNLIKDITNLIMDGLNPLTGFQINLEKIAEIGIWLIAIYIVSSLVSALAGIILAVITQKTAGNLRSDISKKINKIPLRFFDNSSTGDIMSRVTNDADTMGQSMNQSIGMMVSSISMLIGSIVMMFYTNWQMALTAILSTIGGFFLMGFIMSKSQKYFDLQQHNLGKMNGHVNEIYTAHNIVKAYNGEAKAKKEFDEINDRLFESAFKSQFFSGLMMPMMVFVGNFGYVMVCIIGALLVIDGTITVGIIAAFMIYVRLFSQPLSQISQALASMQSVAAGAERVFAFLDEKELTDESGKTQRIERSEGHVEFRDVHFGYVEGKEIIHGFSAEVHSGQKVAIVGPTGAGKTTMVNLLMKFYEVNSGDILIDGISINELTRENVHEQFCMVLQDTWLFNGTIRENIVYCRTGVSNEKVEEACKAVGIHHFITTLPQGYDTVLGDNVTLSVGQKQQLTIARAMVDDSPMLILDEATSSVDTRTEKIIQDAMDKLAEGRTSFVIAHRLSTIKNSDMILVVRDGNIVEQGTHDELLAKGGFYEELYNSQFDDAE